MALKNITQLSLIKPWKGVGEFSLEPIIRVLEELDNPQDKFPSIHVAGTNGKGSTCSFLSSIFQRAGKRVGLLTSPHLERVNERVKLDGRNIEDSLLDEYLGRVFAAQEKVEETLSYFECITAVGFLYFAESEVDYGIIEVGLGGRLDATNVLKAPVATIITSISLDHERLLGETEALIAAEKAGIIKEKVPVVCGVIGSEPLEVIKGIAKKKHAELLKLGSDFTVFPKENGAFSLRSEFGTLSLKPSLRGIHQVGNSALAAYVAHSLGIESDVIEDGISKCFWPARLEKLTVNDCEFLFDCAHNLAGMKTLANYLEGKGYRDLRAVVGFLEAKEWEEMLVILNSYVKAYEVAEPDSNRALSADTLAEKLKSEGKFTSVHYRDHERLIEQIFEKVTPGSGPVLVTGSIYLVSKIREILKSYEDGALRRVS